MEEFDPEALRHGSPVPRAINAMSSDPETESPTQISRSRVRKDSANHNSLTNRAKRGARSKKVPYESKSARKAANLKQRARKLEKANLAASRSGDRRKGENKIKKSKRR